MLWTVIRFLSFQITQLWKWMSATIGKRLRFSITFKTTVTYTLVFSFILTMLSILLTISFAGFLLYSTDCTLQKDSQYIAALIGSGDDLPFGELANWSTMQGVLVTLYDENSNPVWTSAKKAGSPVYMPRIQLTPTSSLDEYLHYEQPVMLTNGIARIELAQYLYEEMSYLAILAGSLAATSLFAILLTIFIGSRVSRKMLRPIDNMTRTARSITAGDLNTRLDTVTSHDELKDLTVTFNEMLDRIQNSFEQQKSFVADASHELRTPIAVIQGYANLLDRWGKEDKAVLEESIAAIKSEADFMKELVDKLLFLASGDKNGHALQRVPFALNELIDEVIRETRLIDTGHNILGNINDKAEVTGDRTLVKQALRILVDNSIKYTPAGGSVIIESHLRNNKARITIEDTGIGISAEELPHIFERFYKSDRARSREGGGAGLGLSIAKLIIENNQGNIQVESRPGQGTKFSIWLPSTI